MTLSILLLAVAVAPASYAPTGRWHVAGDEGRCIMSRPLTGTAGAAEISIEPLPTTDSVELVLRTPKTNAAAEVIEGAVAFGDAKAQRLYASSFNARDGIHRVTRWEIDRAAWMRLRTSGLVRSEKPRDAAWSIALGPMEAAAAVLDRCEDALVRSATPAGIEPRPQRYPAVPVMLIRMDPNYVAAARRGDLEDVAIARYLIDVRGMPQECALVHRAATASLNNGVCHTWGPLRFKPAVGAAGKPVPGISLVRRRWSLPAPR